MAPAWLARRSDLAAHGLGRLGEELAARYLVARGWRIRARRLDTDAGEVDLLAREPDGTLVCVEVKTRRATALPRRRGATVEIRDERSRPSRNLKQRQVRRLVRAARAVRARRVDLVEVWIVPGTAPVLRHTVDIGTGSRA